MPILQPIDGGTISAPGAAVLDTVLTSANAKTVYDAPSLVDLWIPELWLDENGARKLIGAKNYRRMQSLSGTDFPTITANMFGTRSGLLAGTTAGTVGDLANFDSIMPTNRSFSVVCGLQPNIPASTAQYPWGTDGASATYCWVTSSGNVRVYSMGVLHLTSSGTVSGTAPHVSVYSYRHNAAAASRVSTLRVNKAAAASKTSIPDAEVNTNQRLQFLAFGAGGTAASASMRLGPVMLFDGIALTDTGNEALLAAAENLAYALTGM